MNKISGTHLIIDGYVRDGQTLNPDTICSMFDAIVDTLNMRYLQRPVAMRVPIDPSLLNTDEDEGGWSVICQITTSHITLHGWPMRGAFMMDIFSCREFNVTSAWNVVKEYLGVKDKNITLVDRKDPIHG